LLVYRRFSIPTWHDTPISQFRIGFLWRTGGGGCLALGTQIEVPGGRKAVESLAIGDDVLSFDPQAGKVIVSSIASISCKENVSCVEINGQWVVSKTQCVLSARGEWVEVRALVPGMRLYCVDSERMFQIRTLTLIGLRRIFEFQTNHDSHNVIAAGAVFHNAKCM
jgi:hypothetical protein